MRGAMVLAVVRISWAGARRVKIAQNVEKLFRKRLNRPFRLRKSDKVEKYTTMSVHISCKITAYRVHHALQHVF